MVSTKQIDLCRTIATIAHTAKGQKRADKTTPYIVHPAKVVKLLQTWYDNDVLYDQVKQSCSGKKVFAVSISIAQAAGWLHDVVEDTKVTLNDLMLWGVDSEVIEIVDLLTKKNSPSEPENAAYYEAIGKNDTALLTKLADRCANIEDATDEVIRTKSLKRWKPYVERTIIDFLPYFDCLPILRKELKYRIDTFYEFAIVARGGDLNGTFDCGAEVKKNA